MNELKILQKEYKKSSDYLFKRFKRELDELTIEYVNKLNKIKDR